MTVFDLHTVPDESVFTSDAGDMSQIENSSNGTTPHQSDGTASSPWSQPGVTVLGPGQVSVSYRMFSVPEGDVTPEMLAAAETGSVHVSEEPWEMILPDDPRYAALREEHNRLTNSDAPPSEPDSPN